MSLTIPKCVQVNRFSIYDDVIEVYSTDPNIVQQFPLSVKFQGEAGLDFGGVGRDFFSAFWEQAYKRMFDGAALLTPVSHADVDMSHFDILRRVLSHGYLCCGFLPTRIAYPVLAAVIFGPSVKI